MHKIELKVRWVVLMILLPISWLVDVVHTVSCKLLHWYGAQVDAWDEDNKNK